MYALRERRVHVSQDDFEMAVWRRVLGAAADCVQVAKVMNKDSKDSYFKKLFK